MDPLTLAAVLGGVGLLKSMTVDKSKEDRERNLAANTQRYSPWTGLAAQPVKEADPFGSAINGAVSGAALGQNVQAADKSKQLSASIPNTSATTSPASAYNTNLDLGMSPGTPGMPEVGPTNDAMKRLLWAKQMGSQGGN